MPAPNAAITESIWLRDNAVPSQPITGAVQADFAISDPQNDDIPADTAALTITEVDSINYPGKYWTTYTPISAGKWSAYLSYNQGGVSRAWALTDTVTDPATDAQPIASAVLAASVTGGAANTVAAKLNEIGTTTVDATVPIEANPSTIPIIRGDTYSNALGNAIDFTETVWPDLTAATISMEIATISGTNYSLPMTVVTPTGTAEVRLELTSAVTAAFPVFVGRYEVVATLVGPATATLATGTFYAKD